MIHEKTPSKKIRDTVPLKNCKEDVLIQVVEEIYGSISLHNVGISTPVHRRR
jgi:hypothetical protein